MARRKTKAEKEVVLSASIQRVLDRKSWSWKEAAEYLAAMLQTERDEHDATKKMLRIKTTQYEQASQSLADAALLAVQRDEELRKKSARVRGLRRAVRTLQSKHGYAVLREKCAALEKRVNALCGADLKVSRVREALADLVAHKLPHSPFDTIVNPNCEVCGEAVQLQEGKEGYVGFLRIQKDGDTPAYYHPNCWTGFKHEDDETCHECGGIFDERMTEDRVLVDNPESLGGGKVMFCKECFERLAKEGQTIVDSALKESEKLRTGAKPKPKQRRKRKVKAARRKRK